MGGKSLCINFQSIAKITDEANSRTYINNKWIIKCSSRFFVVFGLYFEHCVNLVKHICYELWTRMCMRSSSNKMKKWTKKKQRQQLSSMLSFCRWHHTSSVSSLNWINFYIIQPASRTTPHAILEFESLTATPQYERTNVHSDKHTQFIHPLLAHYCNLHASHHTTIYIWKCFSGISLRNAIWINECEKWSYCLAPEVNGECILHASLPPKKRRCNEARIFHLYANCCIKLFRFVSVVSHMHTPLACVSPLGEEKYVRWAHNDHTALPMSIQCKNVCVERTEKINTSFVLFTEWAGQKSGKNYETVKTTVPSNLVLQGKNFDFSTIRLRWKPSD